MWRDAAHPQIHISAYKDAIRVIILTEKYTHLQIIVTLRKNEQSVVFWCLMVMLAQCDQLSPVSCEHTYSSSAVWTQNTVICNHKHINKIWIPSNQALIEHFLSAIWSQCISQLRVSATQAVISIHLCQEFSGRDFHSSSYSTVISHFSYAVHVFMFYLLLVHLFVLFVLFVP